MFHGKPIPSLGELRIVWKLSNLGACLELCVRQRLLNKIRIRTEESAQVPRRMDVQPNPPKTQADFSSSAATNQAAGASGKRRHQVTRQLIGQSQKTLELRLEPAPVPALIYSS